MGANRLIGHFRPTEKNSMVAEHYLRLGFTALPDESGIDRRFELRLDTYQTLPTFFVITEN